MVHFLAPLDPPFQKLKPHRRFTQTRASFSFRWGSNNVFWCVEGKLKLIGSFSSTIKCKTELCAMLGMRVLNVDVLCRYLSLLGLLFRFRLTTIIRLFNLMDLDQEPPL
ncbi:hypothetical protein K1719_027922 [Acacia pycnantha]|nr:hypothetical protein K1719_027922 [Acacia pycnantha]